MPRRDFWLIPLLVLATILVMTAASEVVTREVFTESGGESCGSDTTAGVPRMRPNCVSHRKAAEGPPVENTYNDCGYRTPQSCRLKPPDALRVALAGTSTAEGFKVPYKETFAARLTEELGVACGRNVEFQNMGIAGSSPLDVYRRMDEALAMNADLVMLVFTAWDLKERIDPAKLAARDEPEPVAPPTPAPPAARDDNRSIIARLSDLSVNSRALLAAQHYLFQDRATYVRMYMLHGDDAGYLRPPYTSSWEARLADFDLLFGGMARRAHERCVPMLLVLAPSSIQVALRPADMASYGADPFAIGRRMNEIAARHGASFVDTLADFARTPSPEQLFYPVDGHIDGAGSAVFANALRLFLTTNDAMPFATCRGERQTSSQAFPR
jgi:hypothetical protein